MDLHSRLAQSTVAIVKHTYTPTGGVEQELLRYLIPRARGVVYVSHPFRDARGVPLNTAVSIYEGGVKRDEILAPLVKGPAPVSFAKDVLFTLWYLLRRKTKFQLYVGVDNLNAFTGLLLRRLGIVERVVFYVIDYAPNRFSNRTGQALYRALDRRCCYGADAVWNVSASMEDARKADGIEPRRCAPQIEVPLGSRYAEIPRLAFEQVDPDLIVFLGSLRPEQGLDTMIEAMPGIRRAVPAARLRVIGDGPEAASLKKLAVDRGVADAVEFLGYVENDNEAAKLLADAAIGVAPYVRSADTFKRFADPGKVKLYLAAGLPVVISRVPRIAGVIEKSGAGIAVEPGSGNLADAVISILSSSARACAMRANAAALGAQYDWDGIFDRAFEQTFALWSTPRQ
jgi:glycosyltransferase involved in cell wall biosynthesis